MANSRKKTKPESAPACPEGLDLPAQTREEYVGTVLQQVAAFEERLEELESDMESSGWDDIGDFRGRLDDLRLRLKGLRSRSDELEAAPDAAWPDARGEMEESLAEVAESIDDLVSGLRMVLPE
jgi:hypothetical protein